MVSASTSRFAARATRQTQWSPPIDNQSLPSSKPRQPWRDLSHPIVSVSLGVPAVFLWGGLRRADRAERVPLFHGDVVVWGGVDRLRFHGVAPVRASTQALTGGERINFTLRRAGNAPDPMVSSN